MCRDEFLSLWDELSYEWANPWLGRSVRIFDIRHVLGIPNGESRLAHALLAGSEGGEHCDATLPDPETVDTLPITGASMMGAGATAAGLLVGGALALRMARSGARRPIRGRHLRHPDPR